MPVDFSGKWAVAKFDDFSPMLEKLQIPEDKRPPPNFISKLTIEVRHNGDRIEIVSQTSMGERVNAVEVGKTCKFVMFGNMIEADVTAAWDGDRLVITDTGRGVKLIRELVGDQTLCTFVLGDVEVKLYYDRV
nr:fatty acid-binding protein, liver-like [Lytechinus pictus]